MATNLPADNSTRINPEKLQTRKVVTSRELMGNGKELIIQHAGEEYRLRITKQSKMILTK